MRRTTILFVLFILLTATVVAAPTEHYINGSEPAFLKDIGPQDQRSDKPIVAAITALVVAAVFYRGFKRYDSINGEEASSS